MKQFILKNKKALAGTIAVLLIGGITMSFQDSPFAYSKFSVADDPGIYSACTDTLPEKEGMKMQEFDKLQTELDRSLLQVNDELKKMDFSKMQLDIETALKSVDMDKIRKDVDLALKNVDMSKLMAEVSASIKNIDIDYNKADIEKALAEAAKEIDKAKLEIKEIDKEKLKKELTNAQQEIDKAKLKIEKIDMDKVMTEARAGIDKAKEELKLTKEMFTEMEKDGLISSKDGFTIEYKNKDLYIDGVKQPEKTTDKYRKYFKKEDFKIKINKD
jgi:hypothetical protein